MIYLIVFAVVVAIGLRWLYCWLLPTKERYARRKDFDETDLGRGR